MTYFLIRKTGKECAEVASEDVGGPPWHPDKNQVSDVLPLKHPWIALLQ